MAAVVLPAVGGFLLTAAAATSSSSSMLTDPRVKSSKKLTKASLIELVGDCRLLLLLVSPGWPPAAQTQQLGQRGGVGVGLRGGECSAGPDRRQVRREEDRFNKRVCVCVAEVPQGLWSRCCRVSVGSPGTGVRGPCAGGSISAAGMRSGGLGPLQCTVTRSLTHKQSLLAWPSTRAQICCCLDSTPPDPPRSPAHEWHARPIEHQPTWLRRAGFHQPSTRLDVEN